MARPPARLLVVCTANVCRSPLAAALVEELVDHHAPDGARALEVPSAGTHARPDLPAAPGMARVATAWGLDLSAHRSRPLDREVAEAADLVVTMEAAQRDMVARLAPGLTTRTFTFPEVGALVEHAAATGTSPTTDAGVAGWVRWLHRSRMVLRPPADEVGDPYGGPEEGYLRAAHDLADLAGLIGPSLVASLDSDR